MSAKAKAAPIVSKRVGRDVSEFRSQHDRAYFIPKRIEDAITKLGPDSWEYEQPFMKLAEISSTDMGAFRDSFHEFIVEVSARGSGGAKKRIWCGSKVLAAKFRAMT